ncbi:MAG TPA: 4Fe-4S binding protein [Deltaproteobacteria bacterium]|nr:4Fe-4S binding protein [Deltaproteobacteria bacterium]HPP80088.1 4Fe-4S binding protein [Deltaproteobacteria bacterium]
MDREGEKTVYRELGRKIDGIVVRAPWNETLHGILRELYTPEEAMLLVKMPYTLSTTERIARVSGMNEPRVRRLLEGLCGKGLVIDLWNEQEARYYYMPSPMVIGIFEFTMMGRAADVDGKKLAALFHEYFERFYEANFSNGERMSILRVIPVEETVDAGGAIEFLDHERVSHIIEEAGRYAIGTCSCRNEKSLLGKKVCDTPIANCSAFGYGADYTIRYGFAREVSRSEMEENFTRSREMGLVFCADNTKRMPTVVCHCCKCCCNYLSGLTRFGFTNSVVTSNYLSRVDESKCTACLRCVDVCPVNAASLVSSNDAMHPKKRRARIDAGLCVGCGVCVSKCPSAALTMAPRPKRVIHPESVFERIMLSSLERGTLQNQIFDDPQSVTQKVMRTVIGAFLRLDSVRKALVSDLFRSSFLGLMKAGAALQGKGWMTEL